jgi:ATP-grasp domain, R2K clade family 3
VSLADAPLTDMPLADMPLACVQVPTAAQRADAAAAAGRGEFEPFLHDLQSVHDELLRRGVEVRPFRSGEPLPALGGLRPDQVFVFGGLVSMWHWLRTFGLAHRLAPSYPPSLAGLLHRRCWQGTPAELLPCRPWFDAGDRVDGAVWPSLDALLAAHPGLAEERLFCSERVGWVGEYRCYVLHGRLLGMHPYQMLGRHCGRVDATALERHMPELRPDPAFVADAIGALEAAGEAPAAYALDFGLIAHGRMALVELNDAVALTNYGLPVHQYVDLHAARWQQIARAEPCDAAEGSL